MKRINKFYDNRSLLIGIGIILSVTFLLALQDGAMLSADTRMGSIASDPAAIAAAPNPETPATQAANDQEKAGIIERFGQAPLHFEPNDGQAGNDAVRFISRGPGYNLSLSPAGATISLSQPAANKTAKKKDLLKQMADAKPEEPTFRHAVVNMHLVGANEQAASAGLEELEGQSNYYVGNDPEKWKTGVANYGRVRFEETYPGIALEYYGNQRQLEYDFIVDPNADASQIRLKFDGVRKIKVDKQSGELVLRTAIGEIRQKKPFVYQTDEATGEKREVASGYKVNGKEVSFALGNFDRERQLTIDPVVLAYSTYHGGFDNDYALAIAVDSTGNAYVTGRTPGWFPILNAQQPVRGGGTDAFVSKFSPTGILLYSTYHGGALTDLGERIAVDPVGNAYITGGTYSTDFPVLNARQPTLGGTLDAFVSKFSPTGVLLYSTYHGGSVGDEAQGIAVDSDGSVYLAGATLSTNFPILNAQQPALAGLADVFVSKFSPLGELVYSTYRGGTSNDYGHQVAVDSAHNVYVTGTTGSNDFPVLNARQPTYGGGTYDGFVSKFSPTGSLVYSTFHGGTGMEESFGMAVDPYDNAYISGFTSSTDFPILNARQPAYGGGTYDVFVSKFSPTGVLLYSTYHGGSSSDVAWYDVATDSAGNAYISGVTQSRDFPCLNDRQPAHGGGTYDAFVAKFSSTGVLRFSTFHGGSGEEGVPGSTVNGTAVAMAVDPAGNVYVTGRTTSADFPVVNAGQPTNAGGWDAFVSKFAYFNPAQFDFYGDGKTDISVFRPSDGTWYTSFDPATNFGAVQWGIATDRIAPADYDGDGRTDIAVYRPSTGIWYIRNSSNGTFSYYAFGVEEDLPTPADYDGDGKADISVFRQSTGTWYRRNSSDGSFYGVQFGAGGDIPTIGDFDGDGKSDIAVWRPTTGVWYRINSSNGSFFGEQFGLWGDLIVPADYDGDGKTDIAVCRPSNGYWYMKNSSNGAFWYQFWASPNLGWIPVAGDFDGDGKADFSYFLPSDGSWRTQYSSTGASVTVAFGTNGDTPTMTAFRY